MQKTTVLCYKEKKELLTTIYPRRTRTRILSAGRDASSVHMESEIRGSWRNM